MLYTRIFEKVYGLVRGSAHVKSNGILLTYILRKVDVEFKGPRKNIHKYKCINKNSIESFKRMQGGANRCVAKVLWPSIYSEVESCGLAGGEGDRLVRISIHINELSRVVRKRTAIGKESIEFVKNLQLRGISVIADFF